jgi:hypothetical protein
LCHKKLVKDDLIIDLGLYNKFHVDCYKSDRDRVLNSVGVFDKNYLNTIHDILEKLPIQSNYKYLENNDHFFEVWGELLSIRDCLGIPLLNYKLSNTINFFENIKFERTMSSLISRIFNLPESHRFLILPINIAMTEQNLYHTTNKPSINELLKNKEKNMEVIISDLKEIINDITDIYNSLDKLYPVYLNDQKKMITKASSAQLKKSKKYIP